MVENVARAQPGRSAPAPPPAKADNQDAQVRSGPPGQQQALGQNEGSTPAQSTPEPRPAPSVQEVLAADAPKDEPDSPLDKITDVAGNAASKVGEVIGSIGDDTAAARDATGEVFDDVSAALGATYDVARFAFDAVVLTNDPDQGFFAPIEDAAAAAGAGARVIRAVGELTTSAPAAFGANVDAMVNIDNIFSGGAEAASPGIPASGDHRDRLVRQLLDLPDSADANDVYSLITQREQPQQLAPPATPEGDGVRREYLARVSELAQDRPKRTELHGQRLARETLNAILAAARDGQFIASDSLAQASREYFHFFGPQYVEGEIAEHLYVNPNVDHAPEVMEFLVRNVVDRPGEFPGVLESKLAGLDITSRRSDTISVYTVDQSATERVIEALAEYHRSHPDHFGETPLFTESVLPGVGVGEEPTQEMRQGYRAIVSEQAGETGRGPSSRNDIRAGAIYLALRDTREQRSSADPVPVFEEAGYLRERIDYWFGRFGVDPQNPARNLRR